MQSLRIFGRVCVQLILAIAVTCARAESPLPIKGIANIVEFSPADFPIVPDHGRLFFSQYDKSGNNFDVIAFDMADQSSEYVLRGQPGGRFVAQSDKYLVVSGKGRFANPLVVIDRVSGARLRQISLQREISWAKIENNRLIAIQGFSIGGYGAKAPGLVFELPSLKIVKSVEIVGGNDAQVWKGTNLSLGFDLAAYDDEFNELFRIALPKRKPGDGVSCASTWPLRVHADKAVIVTNCGEILVYDLPTRQLERTIPAYSHFYAVAIVDGLIFTVPNSEPKQRDNAHVHELATGRELAVLPINGSDLFAKGDRLLAVEREFARVSPMTLYSVDTRALRSGRWRVEQTLGQCRKAQALLQQSGDLYGAIALCRSAGIEGLAQDDTISEAVLPVIQRYALWLSRTLDRSADAIPILEKLQRIAPGQEVDQALTEVRLTARVLGGRELGALSPAEQRTEMARVLGSGDRLAGSQTRNIDFGSFSNLFHFSGNRVYVGRYGCRTCSHAGASISVLDRETLEEIASIPIAPHDQDYQDAIESIASDGERIYVSVAYRYQEAGRPNFVVINKDTLKIVKNVQVEAPPSLIVQDGVLLACGCYFSEEQNCKLLEPETGKSADAPGKICAPADGVETNVVVRLRSDQEPSERFVAVTRDFLVARKALGKNVPYTFYPRAIAGQPVSVRLSPAGSLDWPISISDNSILIREAVRNGQLIKLVTAPTGATRTLLGLPASRLREPVPLLHGQTLFVGLGHDLLIFDVKSNRLRRYIRDFIPAGFKDNGNGLDVNRIDRLITDRGRLIAITFHGEHSRIVPLSSLGVAEN
jgi:hypothetical protein